MPEQRGEKRNDAGADAAFVHDEASQDKERQGEEDEAAGSALRGHRDGDGRCRTSCHDVNDADRREHKADRQADDDERDETDGKQKIERGRTGPISALCQQQRHDAGDHKSAGGKCDGARTAPERMRCVQDEDQAAEDHRQGHPEIGDAEHRRALGRIHQLQRDRGATNGGGDSDDGPVDDRGQRRTRAWGELFRQHRDGHEAPAAIGDAAADEGDIQQQ